MVRYGELPESLNEVNEVLDCLRRVEQAIHYMPKPDAIKKMTT
jgi:hypothetical protein